MYYYFQNSAEMLLKEPKAPEMHTQHRTNTQSELGRLPSLLTH